MWKPNQPANTPSSPNEPLRPSAPATPAFEPAARPATGGSAQASAGEQASIGKSLVIKGEVSANITAREIVVLGKVRGNMIASDRVDIRSEGSLTGDVAAQRISIEDGAFFKGGIDIRKPDTAAKPAEPAKVGV